MMQGRPPDKSTKCKLRELDIDTITRVCCGSHITMEQTGAQHSDPVGAGVTSTKIVQLDQLDRATNRTLVVVIL